MDNEENSRAKSHKGLFHTVVCNQREQYVPACFDCEMEKIQIDNKRGHKTYDWTMKDASGKAIGIVECYAGNPKRIGERVHKALKHSESKEGGICHYMKKVDLPEDPIRIAVHVHGVPANIITDGNKDRWRKTIKESICRGNGTNMDGLLYIWANEAEYSTVAVYFDISGRDVRDYLEDDIEYCSVPRVIRNEERQTSFGEEIRVPMIVHRCGGEAPRHPVGPRPGRR